MKRINVYAVKLVKESGSLYNVNSTRINTPALAAEVIEKVFSPTEEAVEVFGVLALDTKNKVAGMHIISKGILDNALVHPREVFKPAILNNAAHIIIWHNHPSGDPTPSHEDLALTQKLVDAGKLLGIGVIDHLVFGDSAYSFKDKDIMPI
jgi:DNA repair protein RadC